MRNFGRTYRVLAFTQSAQSPFFGKLGGGVQIDNLDIQCKVEKTLTEHPNTGELTLYNLSDQSRREFEHRPLTVHVEAGYQGVNKLLFSGDVRPGSYSKLKPPEWETKLILGDGARAFSGAFISKSYTKGTPVKTIIRDIVKSFDLQLPPEIDADPQLRQGLVVGDLVHGPSALQLSRFLAPYGYDWSTQNGQMQVVKFDAPATGQIFEVSQASGMLDTPELGTSEGGKPPTLTVNHTLYPELIPGRLIKVTSRSPSVNQASKTGVYKLQKVSHELDTKGDNWNTKLEATPQ